jgi:predicted transcriptional regulator
MDVAVLGLLLSTDRLWSAEEVGREIGDPVEAADSLARLHGAGLVHRLQDFVFPTRAAVEAARLG